ncbi:MAG: glycosyltransferase [Clostridia bacterium]|nr:glycosyltransferase [Clostridia bacterium]
MKKIAIIVHGLSSGGAERVASLLASYLAENRYEVLFICAYHTPEEDSKAPYPLDSRVTVKYIPVKTKISPLRFMTRSVRIRQAVKAFSPDWVVSLITYEAILTTFSKYPVVYSLRNDPGRSMAQGFRSKLLLFMFSRSKKIVFQSQGARDFFQGKIKEKSVVIPNPINTKELPLWTDYAHEKKFMTACRLRGQKNLPMLVEAFSMVHKEHPDYTLEIYGQGDQENVIKEKIQSLHAESYVFLKGFSADVHGVMARSSGFVLSSNHEGLSNSMLEALCMGVPCVCTDCPPGSVREYIVSGENGFLTKVGDAQDMKEKICALIENQDLSPAFAQKNLAVRQKMDVEFICKEWAQLFE